MYNLNILASLLHSESKKLDILVSDHADRLSGIRLPDWPDIWPAENPGEILVSLLKIAKTCHKCKDTYLSENIRAKLARSVLCTYYSVGAAQCCFEMTMMW